MKTPCLFTTYNRIEYSKKALNALMRSDDIKIIVIDNNSTDGTIDWLKQFKEMEIIYNPLNIGVAGAMNIFLSMTVNYKYVSKCDNDTVCPKNWVSSLIKHLDLVDMVQAKHPILKATHPGGFDAWVKTMKKDGALRFNHFIGGSGILFKRNIVDKIPATEWKLGGWRAWQREHPQYKKAFATDVEIQLLDTNEQGANYSTEHEHYYKETQRL